MSVRLNTVKGIIEVKGRFHVLVLVTVSHQLLLNILPLVYDSEITTDAHQTTMSECILSI